MSEVLSIIVPAYNEQEVLGVFHERLSKVLSGIDLDHEIIYVNDGSDDDTSKILEDLQRTDPNIAVVDLSRNFGKELALTAGLDYASGDAVVIIDADLQDPPELIPDFLQHWRDGYDVVYGVRTRREGEGPLKRLTAWVFYKILHRISDINIPVNTGDFRLISRRALDSLLELREQHRYMKGLFSWVGYAQLAVPYERAARARGGSKWSYWRLWNLAVEGITSFSSAPLKTASYLGLAIAVFAILYGTWLIWYVLAYGNPLPGYPSIMVVMLFLGGVQLMTLGVIGEYIARIYSESKGRPLYFVQRYSPGRTSKSYHNRKDRVRATRVTERKQGTI